MIFSSVKLTLAKSRMSGTGGTPPPPERPSPGKPAK